MIHARPRAAALAFAVVMAPHALNAQSLTGSAFVSARCGGSDTVTVTAGSHALSRHAECPAPNAGGIASINDASLLWSIDPAQFSLELDAHTDFFGTRDNAGSADAVLQFDLTATDLVFTDIANPSRTGDITGSLNFLVADSIGTEGVSNCSEFRPHAGVSFFISCAGMGAAGANSFEPTSGLQATGALASIPADGALHPLTSRAALVSLAIPNQFTFHADSSTLVLYCDRPPAAVGDAHALLAWSLPCGSPVFNLPPGITANSAQLGIVNNTWTGPRCCPADFNHDGALNSADFFDFLVAFFAQSPTADFNADSRVDSQDFFDFLNAFFVGCS